MPAPLEDIFDDLTTHLVEAHQEGNCFEYIRQFHWMFDLAYEDGPRDLPDDLRDFRIQFMYEELKEYCDAKTREDALDALVDLVYVAVGTAYLHGFNFNEAFRRVQNANLAKVRAESADDSKRGSSYDVVKPEGWLPPFLGDLV